MKLNLASSRLAFYLLALFAGLIVLSAVIPQRGISEEHIIDWRGLLGGGYKVIEVLRLDSIYSSPMFLITVALMIVNLAAGNLKRIGRIRRIAGRRRKIMLAGSIVFHFALPVIMVGAVLNHLYQFRVVFGLTEGQTAIDQPAGYFRDFSGPLCRAAGGRFTVHLKRIHLDWPAGESTTEAAEVIVTGTGENKPVEGFVRTNHPLRWNELEFHLGSRIGYSPKLQMTDGQGRGMFNSFVRLARRGDRDGIVNTDFIYLPDGSSKVELTVSKRSELHPDVRTQVALTENGSETYRGYPGRGGTRLADGRKISVPQVRRWCYVEAIHNPFNLFIFSGFWLALGGLVVTLVPRFWPAGTGEA